MRAWTRTRSWPASCIRKPAARLTCVRYLRCQAQMAGHWPRFTVALNAALQAESDRLRAAGAARHLFEYFCRSLDAFTESHDPFAPR